MSVTIFEANMAKLESLQGSNRDILEAAAKILGYNLAATTAQCETDNLFAKRPQSHGFKEQWVLRWLLKRLGTTPEPKSAVSGDRLDGDSDRYGACTSLLDLSH
jgi:hypothetical protein